MKARSAVVVLLLALGAVLAPALPARAASAAKPSLDPYEQQLVSLINETRGAHHLAALTLNAALSDAARTHAAEMGQNQYFGHDSLDGTRFSARLIAGGYARKGYRVWRVGEDIAWGAGLYGSPVAVLDSWLHSPMHRAVLLDKHFRELGVGAVSCEGYGAVEGTVWFFTFDAGVRGR